MALSKAEAARLNGKKGGRPRKADRAEKPAKSAKPRTRKPPKSAAPSAPPDEPNIPSKPSDHDQEPIAGAEKMTKAERQRAFLEEFARCGNVLRSCQRLRIARATVYGDWVREPEFKAAFEQAAEDSTDLLEEEARRRAVDGLAKPVYQGGKRVGFIQEYSDSLLMFLLRGKREAYREKRAIGVGVESGATGGLRKVIIEIDESPGAQA